MKPVSLTKRVELLNLAQPVLERLESDRLTRVPLLHLDELPALSGIYFAATENNTILYIGKASDFTDRCKLSTHHKLPAAIERGAVFLYIARAPNSQVWHIEQWLIDAIAPILNEHVSRWWVEPKPKKEKPAGNLGRRKKDADRVNYNISRTVRAAVLKEADRLGWNEIDTIEDLLRHGLAAKAMLKDGEINYAAFVRRVDSIADDAKTGGAES